MRIELLGTPIDAIRRDEALTRIAAFLMSDRGHLVTTPNPEMLVLASRDAGFKRVLRSADLAVPDGFGLVLMALLQGKRIPERITGVDLLGDVVELAARTGKRVYFLGGEEGIASAAADALKKKHQSLIVAGARSGGTLVEGRLGSDVMSAVKEARPDILFVAFGHGKQEKWIAGALPELPTVRFAMGVGGSLDFIAGKAKRAPTLLRKLGLEWLWRLLREPWRAKRIWTAVAVFPWLVLSGKR